MESSFDLDSNFCGTKSRLEKDTTSINCPLKNLESPLRTISKRPTSSKKRYSKSRVKNGTAKMLFYLEEEPRHCSDALIELSYSKRIFNLSFRFLFLRLKLVTQKFSVFKSATSIIERSNLEGSSKITDCKLSRQKVYTFRYKKDVPFIKKKSHPPCSNSKRT